ncbi:hypothetical protein HOP50_12g67940 [Chloropicon primus]|uniref:Uncharacterized protein n=1 Tax=Chloropicon primus TaxID=1764295 RepID=A0A5B8MTZ9_9CHLO|nr:hypothetical protein A3770_12p67760 [Chloropicon primus]UPR03465.1 hypothetical protein HOP50_12g67940 [Chloropicon primus]|eukprot:QDZ24258.1 hypothetical protein A3770_12p67760 [Chloropicon primus]
MVSGGVKVYNRDLLQEVCQAGDHDLTQGGPGTNEGESSSFSIQGGELGGLGSDYESSSLVSLGGRGSGKDADQGQGGANDRFFAANLAGADGAEKVGGPSGSGRAKKREEPASGGVGRSLGGGMGKIGGMDEGKSTKLQTIAANEERYRQMHEKARREAERRIQENAKRRELQFNEMFANVQNGIDRKSGILKEVDQLVEQSDRSKDKRARALYQSWNEQVYNNIQKQIQDQLSALTTEEIEARLNRKYDAFLLASNQKAGVFMNNPSSTTTQYNVAGMTTTTARVGGGPEEVSKGDIKVRTANLHDPLKRSLLKIKEEKSIYDGRGGGLEAEREELGRECLDTTLWGEEMLQTTPYGHILKEYYDPALESKLHMNHFQYPKGNKVAFENFPKGKREKPSQSERAKAMFHLVGHTCKEQPGVTGGDMWLEAKGKQRRSHE